MKGPAIAALGAAATAGRAAARETNDLREAVEAVEERLRADARRALLSGLADIVKRRVRIEGLGRKRKRGKVGEEDERPKIKSSRTGRARGGRESAAALLCLFLFWVSPVAGKTLWAPARELGAGIGEASHVMPLSHRINVLPVLLPPQTVSYTWI